MGQAARNFRAQKILTAVDQAAGAITNAEMQQDFIDDVNKVLKLSGKERRDALMNLMSLASGSPSTKKEMSQAIILSGGASL